MATLSMYLVLGAALFIIGVAGILLRRNVLIVLMSLELMLNSVNVNLVAFSSFLGDFRGQIVAIFVIAITACEVAIALGILVALIRNNATLDVVDITIMKG